MCYFERFIPLREEKEKERERERKNGMFASTNANCREKEPTAIN